jgi:hypothetical protein
LDVPAAVVTVTVTLEGAPLIAGTERVQEVGAEQLVPAGSPLNRARTCPSALLRFAPETTTV